MTYDCAIIGGGIVGLSTALTLSRRQPGCSILLLEKEADLAKHQTGRNSGVIHSGIYYKPGSFKAKFAREGSASMVRFCQEHGLAYEVCGKVIVATEQRELPLLENLFQRGLQNGLNVARLSPAQVKEIEPHVRCLAGIKVPSTGIVGYSQVCRKYAELFQALNGTLRTKVKVQAMRKSGGTHVLETNEGDFEARFLVNCAGLHSDRTARLDGLDPGAKIVPFRGEYYELVPEKRYLVKTLIYPVPNPNFPFLGVHFTRSIDGIVEAGPNAVLGLAREGYKKTDFKFRDFVEEFTYPGLWRLASTNWRTGVGEIHRSFSKKAFVRGLKKLVPEVEEGDVVPIAAGVRAQALKEDGALVDDFLIAEGKNSVHVLNAPSPAATSAIPIGEEIAKRVAAA